MQAVCSIFKPEVLHEAFYGSLVCTSTHYVTSPKLSILFTGTFTTCLLENVWIEYKETLFWPCAGFYLWRHESCFTLRRNNIMSKVELYAEVTTTRKLHCSTQLKSNNHTLIKFVHHYFCVFIIVKSKILEFGNSQSLLDNLQTCNHLK